MLEGPPKPLAEKAETVASPEKTPKERYVQLAKELFESGERFPFSGIEEGVYARLKDEETEYPDYTTPIDELLPRLEQEGLKVALGENSESGRIFVLPVGSDNVERDSLQPRQLQLTDGMDTRLKELVLLNRAMYSASRN